MCICSSPDIHYKVNLKLFKEVAKEIDPVLNSLDFQKKSVRVCVCDRDTASSHLRDGACRAGEQAPRYQLQ